MAFVAGSPTSQLRLMRGSDPFSFENMLAACKLSCSVYKNPLDDRSYERADIGNTVLIAFRGSLDPNLFTATETEYGESQINYSGCLDCMKDGNNKPASVHHGALSQFWDIWNNSPVQKEACLECEKGKTVVFTGHFMGGAIASLAALCMLEKMFQPCEPKFVFCITFGFPLIGDEVLARAVHCEKWEDQFCHVVLGGDVFARILLAPSISARQPLEALLPYLKRFMETNVDAISSTDTPMAEALTGSIAELVSTVVEHCSAVVNFSSAAKMSPSNPLIAAVKPLVKMSLYRPFGHCVLCSKTGGIWIENHLVVLPILYFALVLQTSDANSKNFILEHVDYNRILPNALQNIVKLKELSDLPLSDAGSRIETQQLDALELGIQGGRNVQNCSARLFLKAAIQFLKQQRENVYKMEKVEIPMRNLQVLEQQRENVYKFENEYPGEMKIAMKKLVITEISKKTLLIEIAMIILELLVLEDYRSKCFKNGTRYLDAFKKKQLSALDFHALEFARWSNYFDKNELPDDLNFQANLKKPKTIKKPKTNNQRSQLKIKQRWFVHKRLFQPKSRGNY